MKPLQARWASSMTALRRRVEPKNMNDGPGSDSNRLAADIRLEITYQATPEAVFTALTTDVGAWWNHPYLSASATGVSLDASLGGLFIEEWGSEGGAVIAQVSALERGRSLEMTGRFHMGVVFGIAEFVLEANPSGTSLRFSFRAIGDPDPNVAPYAAEGWNDLLGVRLKSVIEHDHRSSEN